ncbi:MAG: TM2 domain-containing protein [Chloroflexota bacterium]|nr:MAG: TM2 domain-containing protein [Chloroflexota bacterium]
MKAKQEWKQQLTILIISFLGGYFGLDRFYRGEVALGVIKLITCGGFGVWYLVDVAIAAYRFGQVSQS